MGIESFQCPAKDVKPGEACQGGRQSHYYTEGSRRHNPLR